ncbi:MAG: 3'-5' exonuclease [Nostoc sp.]
MKKDLEDIAKMPGYSFQFFNDAITQYKQAKALQYQGLDNEDQMLENLKDKVQAIATIYQSQPQARGIDDLKYYIDGLFSDENSPITLSTCHRAKGLEGDRIFIYKPDDMPMTWKNQQQWQLEQEKNLLYVALTRSKSELFIVGECDWYKPPSTQTPHKAESDELPKISDNQPAKNDDFFSLYKQEREKLDEELSPIFKNKNSREKFIKTIIDDDIYLGILEDSGKIKYTSPESKKAVYTAIDNYWVRFGIASRKEEEIEKNYQDDEYDF